MLAGDYKARLSLLFMSSSVLLSVCGENAGLIFLLLYRTESVTNGPGLLKAKRSCAVVAFILVPVNQLKRWFASS